VKAILVRVGVDQAYGAWNAPVNPETGAFVYVPIPDSPAKAYTPANMRGFAEIDAPLADFAVKNAVSGLRCPESLRQRNMHLDPDFENLTYGDNGKRRGSAIAKLASDDLLVFYAGMRSITPPRKLQYALVGLFVIQGVVPAIEVPPERRHENAHTRWTEISENDVVVRGKPGLSGRFNRSIPIGEWRDNAYRVCRDLEESWGGLTVKNGYIQRSVVPPAFIDAEKFYVWFRQQGITLTPRNN
jgi:hypothetical protein